MYESYTRSVCQYPYKETINTTYFPNTPKSHLARFSIDALASDQAKGEITFARRRVVGMSAADIHGTKVT